ncbi:DDE superfamily endonuclease [Nitzschia inconspicua]|uniref:DDE superfamily endonuclease n=1 Tax=Nitzschia inconspicua TaxID=303405 RepID=A0A9K3LLA8_9STRA|nr:DDE superfamily endonuclease [Nitzschia inconspicua]KAG7342548.1 DDE superfamily endonuclease [Nitzschia inconspicua]KAG7345049.1 DDE superfamily endonuclease [Nitzschia inconspicua]KAG7358696.1 DDE superfamily endonuclease [Nitzschia inconspicua]KAG7364157.1 DDE superfamily endonuclease [Nitzschia inconspicua]
MSVWCLISKKGGWSSSFVVFGPFQMSLFRHWESEIGQYRCPIEAHPQGLHSVVQPIDVGVNKPLKDRIKSQWWEWMIGFGQDGGNIPTPSREDVQHWVVEAWNSIGAHIIRNAWRKTDLSYFPEE